MLRILPKNISKVAYTDEVGLFADDDIQAKYREELGRLINDQYEMLMEEELGLTPTDPIRYAYKAGIPLPDTKDRQTLLDYLQKHYPECLI